MLIKIGHAVAIADPWDYATSIFASIVRDLLDRPPFATLPLPSTMPASRRRRLIILFATFMSASFCAGCLIFYFVFWPPQLVRNTALLAYTLEQGFEAYFRDHESFPEGSPAQLVEALLGDNLRQKAYVRPEMRGFLDDDGEVRDSWKQPFRFDRADPTTIKVLSAGPNGAFGDDDDITSDQLDVLLLD